MSINITTLESSLQSKLNATTSSTESKDFLLLTKSLESINSGAVSEIANTGALPTASANTGRVYFVTADSKLYFSNGSAWVAMSSAADITAAVNTLVDSAPGALDTLNELAAALGDDANFSTTVTNSIATKLPLTGGTMTGAIAMNGANITLGTSSGGSDDRIALGASAHGQVYHDGTNFLIQETGSGNLLIDGSNISLRSATSENYINCAANGAVTLYHDNSTKLATTATGVTVTGTVAATAFTGDGSGLTGVGFTTNVITSNTTATKDNHYYINGSAITLTLPSSPTVGDEVRLSEVAGNVNCIVGRNGSNIMSSANNLNIDTAYLVLSLRYVDATIGWAFS